MDCSTRLPLTTELVFQVPCEIPPLKRCKKEDIGELIQDASLHGQPPPASLDHVEIVLFVESKPGCLDRHAG